MRSRLSGRSFCSRHARRAFTTTELLVAMAIVATLVGTFVPALAQSRSAAKRVHCAHNLREQAQAAQMFAMNNSNGLLTGCRNSGATDNYFAFVSQPGTPKSYPHAVMVQQGYVKNPEKTFYCPAQTNPKFLFQPSYDYTTFASTIRAGYSTFATFSAQRWQSQGVPLNDSRYPALKGDFVSLPFGLGSFAASQNRAIYTDGVQLYNDVDLCHETGMNVAYGDGSVKFVDRAAFEGPLSQLVHPGAAGLDNAAAAALWADLDAAK